MRFAAKSEPNEKKLSQIRKAGFDSLEVYTDKQIVEDESNIRLLRTFPLLYVVHAPPDYFDESVIEFAHNIEARLINTHKIITNERLQELVEYASRYGITITVENEAFPEAHNTMGGRRPAIVQTYDPVRSGGDFKRLVVHVPDVQLCVDIEHAIIRREFPEILTSCAKHLGHIHLSGFVSEDDGYHRPVYCNIRLMREVAQILRECAYIGFVVCEHGTKYHTEENWYKTIAECKSLFV